MIFFEIQKRWITHEKVIITHEKVLTTHENVLISHENARKFFNKIYGWKTHENVYAVLKRAKHASGDLFDKVGA